MEGLLNQFGKPGGFMHRFRRCADAEAYVLVHAREGDVESRAGRQDRQAMERDQLRTGQIKLSRRPLHVRYHQVGARHLSEPGPESGPLSLGFWNIVKAAM